MKFLPAKKSPRGFTLIELLFSISIGLVEAGSVVYLLYQTAREQRKGLVNFTVEERALLLEANVNSVVRSWSASQTINFSGQALVGTNVVGSQSIIGYNGTPAQIQFVPATGAVIYMPNTTIPAVQTVWFTNNATCRVTNLYFNASLNLDGSANNSLLQVNFTMDDNGFSQANPTNNPASVNRNFCIQLRND